MNDVKDYPLWTAIVTPMNADLTVDYESFEHILKEQERNNIALVVLGSTGEGLAFNETEKREIIEFVSNLNLNVPIMVGVGGSYLPGVLDWLKFCESKNIDAYLMPTPLYAKPGPVGQHAWFETLLNAVKRPCMLYNVPSRTGKDLSLQAVEKLKTHPNFWAIKEASGSVDQFKKYQETVASQMLYSGDDALMPDFAKHGCKGLVSVASNVWPMETLRYVEKSLNNEISASDKKHWVRCTDELFSVSNPIPAKVLLKLQGKIKNQSLRPPLTEQEIQNYDSLLAADEKMKEWT